MSNPFAPLRLLSLAAILFLCLAALPALAQTQAQIDKAYSNYLARHKQVDATFAHDVDVKGKLLDFAKTFVDKTAIGIDNWDKVKNAVVAGYELWEAEGKPGGMDEFDVARFVAKAALPFASDSQFEKLGLSEKKIAFIRDHGPDLADATGSASGAAAGGGSWEDVAKEMVAGGIDTFCPQCAIARRAVALAAEGGKVVEAWVQDEVVAAEFKRWDNVPEIPLATLAGHRMLLTNAKQVMMKSMSTEPTEGEVIAFVQAQFERWQVEKVRNEGDAGILEGARQDFLGLSVWQRGQYGKDLDAQAAAYSQAVLDAYHSLMSEANSKCLFESGRQGFLNAATFLVRYRDRPLEQYRKLYRNQLSVLGCREEENEEQPPAVATNSTPLTPEQEEARRATIVDRLGRLDYPKLEAVLNQMNVTPPRSLFECMCAAAHYHSSSAQSAFSPELYIEPYDERYSCQQPGPPCIVAGNGCSRHPLKNDPEIWDQCMEMERMPCGERLDEMISRVLAER